MSHLRLLVKTLANLNVSREPFRKCRLFQEKESNSAFVYFIFFFFLFHPHQISNPVMGEIAAKRETSKAIIFVG